MWGALGRVWKEGRARAVGVSNFGVGCLEELRGLGGVWPPAVNQIEVSEWVVGCADFGARGCLWGLPLGLREGCGGVKRGFWANG